MKEQPNRLAADASPRFAGSDIDRAQPLKFGLDGRLVHGFAGDSVLSAALASGIDTAGMRGGDRLALDERFAPAVIAAGKQRDPAEALPMDRMPAIDGLNLISVGERGAAANPQGAIQDIRRLLRGPSRSLNLRFDSAQSAGLPWLAGTVERLQTDLVVVGAGIAGLSAAVAAGRKGEQVVVLERRQFLGGDAGFFGVTEDEEPPHLAIPRLAAELRNLPNVVVMLRTEALALDALKVRAHQVVLNDGVPGNRQLLIAAKRVVLAQGAPERLPVFPGNRGPGVVGAVAAFHRAERFGVWTGHAAMFSTASNPAYRLARRAAEAGIEVQRVADVRPQPQSRFIDFCKASAIPLAYGTVPSLAIAARGRRRGLFVQFNVAADERAVQNELMWTDQLVVCGGWQPDLSLWLMAGGGARWSAEARQLVATGAVQGVTLAGAAAGYKGTGACANSGVATVAQLFGRGVPVIDDPQVDPMFETPDAATPVVRPQLNAPGTAFLDGGSSLTALATPDRPRGFRWRRRPATGPLTDQTCALSIGDVAAAVQLRGIDPADAGAVAAERCVGEASLPQAGVRLPPPPATALPYPAYLAGRFGFKPTIWLVEPLEPRAFEPGCLIYLNSESASPLLAIGVVLAATAPDARGALALIGKADAHSGDKLVVRDSGGAIRVQLWPRPVGG